MAKLVLQISEEDTPDRIAIHTSLKSYRLMYLINRDLEACFSKLTDLKDLSIYKSTSDTDSYFEVFRWKDEMHDHQWICVKNKLIEQIKEKENLLFEMTSSVSYWDKNYTKADFILEVGDLEAYSDMEELCSRLERIPGILSTQII